MVSRTTNRKAKGNKCTCGGGKKAGKAKKTNGTKRKTEEEDSASEQSDHESQDEDEEGEEDEEYEEYDEDALEDGDEDEEDDEDADEDVDEDETPADEAEKKKKNAAPKEPLAPRGSLPALKNIYRHKGRDGTVTWVSAPPKDVPAASENSETAQYAVIVRNIKSSDARKTLEAHSIIVQSAKLRAALKEILEGYPGVACELERLEFAAPFKPFVHRWTEFAAYRERKDLDEDTRSHLDVLHGILLYEIGDAIKSFEDYIRHGVIQFDDLWMIFQPGAVVVSSPDGQASAFQLVDGEYGANQCGRFLTLRADCVDYSGMRFGRHSESLKISEFIGVKKITSLAAYPLSFDPDREAAEEALVRRGEIFERLAGHHYRQYSGAAVTWDRQGNEVHVEVSGRIVVDIDSFNRFSPYDRRWVRDWSARDLVDLAAHRVATGGDPAPDGGYRLTRFHQMIARCRTRGYSLKMKKWLDFFVAQVDDIVWNKNAFDRLVLDDEHKELIMAFSESQLDRAEGGGASAFDDVIAGKGKGVICLLSGPPGVGKTLTAEAVSEHLRVPLHTLSSGDLGSQPWEVESGLSRILELVARWDAILLLDECDVFLEARSTHDLERNKVVSIFLRTLEYYEGILFMTTNRVDNIDPAFQSRIHVGLEYPELTAASRAAIWRNFLGGRMAVTERDIEELAELPLNGRQIKNVLKTAQLLASRKRSEMRREFIDTVLSIENRRPVKK